MDEFLKREYENLQRQMTDEIKRFCSVDSINDSNSLILKDFVTRNDDRSHEFFKVCKKDVDSCKSSYGLLVDADYAIAVFGFLAFRFEESIDQKEKLHSLMGMNECLGFVRAVSTVGVKRKIDVRNGAKKKLASDPKQEAKSFARECWTEWQKNPERYTGQAEFARDMLEKCPSLKSQASIEKWCREWKKGLSS